MSEFDGVQIVVVDDDETLLQNLEAFLRGEGFVVSTCTTVSGAKELVSQKPPQVALVDYKLATESGLEVVATLRAYAPRLPVILMSSFMGDWVEALVESYAPYACLKKPFSADELRDGIRKVLQGPR